MVVFCLLLAVFFIDFCLISHRNSQKKSTISPWIKLEKDAYFQRSYSVVPVRDKNKLMDILLNHGKPFNGKTLEVLPQSPKSPPILTKDTALEWLNHQFEETLLTINLKNSGTCSFYNHKDVEVQRLIFALREKLQSPEYQNKLEKFIQFYNAKKKLKNEKNKLYKLNEDNKYLIKDRYEIKQIFHYIREKKIKLKKNEENFIDFKNSLNLYPVVKYCAENVPLSFLGNEKLLKAHKEKMPAYLRYTEILYGVIKKQRESHYKNYFLQYENEIQNFIKELMDLKKKLIILEKKFQRNKEIFLRECHNQKEKINNLIKIIKETNIEHCNIDIDNLNIHTIFKLLK